MSKVVIYTDGSCHGNPGEGGYAAVLVNSDGVVQEFSKGYRLTTNNRMELMAAVVGLEEAKNAGAVELYTDSQYVKNGLDKGWAVKWRSNNWMKGPRLKEEVKNPDLWERLLALYEKAEVTIFWVKGHAGNKWNERCDVLANEAASDKSKWKVDDGFEEEKRGNGGEEQGMLL